MGILFYPMGIMKRGHYSNIQESSQTKCKFDLSNDLIAFCEALVTSSGTVSYYI